MVSFNIFITKWKEKHLQVGEKKVRFIICSKYITNFLIFFLKVEIYHLLL